MNSSGLIIRLIDIAMIILFGFIAISDIKVRAQIKLPSEQKEENEQVEPKEPVLMFVKIDMSQGFVVEEGEQVVGVTSQLTDLEKILLERFHQSKAMGRELVVLIEPDEDSMIQYTVNVMDICERNSIPKNINYESMQF